MEWVSLLIGAVGLVSAAIGYITYSRYRRAGLLEAENAAHRKAAERNRARAGFDATLAQETPEDLQRRLGGP